MKDFALHVEGDRLIVSGRKRFAREGGDGSYRLRECAYGSFSRTFVLPSAVQADRAQATYRRGILRIDIPKVAGRERRRLEVKVE